MTSIAVTASVWASASDAARLVAALMSLSLDLGRFGPRPAFGHDSSWRETRFGRPDLILGTPRDEYSLLESPLSEYRPYQVRTVLRRQFGSCAAGLRGRGGAFRALEPTRDGAPESSSALVICLSRIFWGKPSARIAGANEVTAVEPVPAAGHDPVLKNQKTQVRNGPHRIQRSRQAQ
jgi:hypothetical protein